jgi:hypothetical protein
LLSSLETFMKTFSTLIVLSLPWLVVAAADQDEAAAVARLVQETQRAGFERHDFDKYMTLWADDAKIIVARGEKPGRHDLTLSRAQIEATRRVLFRADPPKDVKMTFANVRPEVDGDSATVRYRTTIGIKDYVETVAEVFRLRKKDGHWQAVENRAWPIETRNGDETTRYNAETWQRLDGEVAKHENEPPKLLPALMDAWRFIDAHAAAKKWTGQDKDKPEAWLWRGLGGMAAGDATDAMTSFDKALALDPKSVVPDYVRAAKKK